MHLLTSEVVFPNLNFIYNFDVGFSLKRRHATQENIENNSDTPNVAFLIILPLNDLGSDIVSCANLKLHLFFRSKELRCTEIDKLNS